MIDTKGTTVLDITAGYVQRGETVVIGPGTGRHRKPSLDWEGDILEVCQPPETWSWAMNTVAPGRHRKDEGVLPFGAVLIRGVDHELRPVSIMVDIYQEVQVIHHG